MKKKRHLKPGDKIRKLTVIKYDHSDNHYRSYFLFKCDCGNEKVILGSGVVSGNTKSCGCLFKEFGRKKRISENHSEVTAIICGYKRGRSLGDIQDIIIKTAALMEESV